MGGISPQKSQTSLLIAPVYFEELSHSCCSQVPSNLQRVNSDPTKLKLAPLLQKPVLPFPCQSVVYITTTLSVPFPNPWLSNAYSVRCSVLGPHGRHRGHPRNGRPAMRVYILGLGRWDLLTPDAGVATEGSITQPRRLNGPGIQVLYVGQESLVHTRGCVWARVHTSDPFRCRMILETPHVYFFLKNKNIRLYWYLMFRQTPYHVCISEGPSCLGEPPRLSQSELEQGPPPVQHQAAHSSLLPGSFIFYLLWDWVGYLVPR